MEAELATQAVEEETAPSRLRVIEGAGQISISERLDPQGLVFLGHEQSGTYDQQEISEMAKKGLVVISVGFGQAVFRRKV